ncbi:MAG: transglycosylase domain-containing protein [Lachnospiraceae bacterium]|nr:transglycosylase domain-containing protein [Lachnospiraceae bacterium]
MFNKQKKKKKKTYFGIFLSVFLKLALIIFVVCLVGGIIFAVYFYNKYMKAYDAEAYEMVESGSREDFKLNSPTYVYDEDGNLLIRMRSGGESSYLKYADIPQYAIDAFVAVEDRTFWSNSGYDLWGMLRVIYYYIKTRGAERTGASTITQQLARNSYLTKEVTFERKIKEIYVAKYLTKKYSKEDIMEFYVNDIYFANQYYGLEAAAQGYFGKKAKALSLSQVAYLCAIPNRPAYYDPVKYPDHAIKRRDKILSDMLELKMISEKEYEQATTEKIQIIDRSGSTIKDYQSTYAIDCAVRYFMELQEFPFQYAFDTVAEYQNYEQLYEEVYEETKSDLYNGGYRIYTTLDSDAQDELQKSLDEVLSFDTEVSSTGAYALQGAVTAVDNDTGKVVAIVGGRSDPSGTKQSYTLNRAFQSFRQPGSSIKPLIVYAPALESGYYPGSEVQDISVTEGKKKGVDSTKLTGEPMSLRTAVEKSKNGCAWQVMANIKPFTGLAHIILMEYRNIVPTDYNLAAALGGLTYGVTTAEQAAGYAALVNHGLYRGQTCIASIKDSEGKEIYENKTAVQAYTGAAADTMVDIMKGVVIRGTASKMNWYAEEETEAAGKTGTTNKSKDGWFCGVTPYYSVAVWVGYDTPRELKDLYGSSYPASIWKACMKALIDGKPAKKFVLPNVMPENPVTEPATESPTETPTEAVPTEELTPENPEQPVPENPEQPAPENPAQPSPENPVQPSPENPEQPAPETPVQPAPENPPSQPTPENPQEQSLPESFSVTPGV